MPHDVQNPAEVGLNAPGRDAYVIEAVDRALLLLDLLAANPNLGVTEIARRMGFSKALAFRLLHTLERRDFVIRDPDRRTSSLGYRLLYLADQIDHDDLVVSATKSDMDELARLSREDVNLFVRVGVNSVCVATRPSAHPVRMFAHIGRRGMLHAGGSSTVLLAYAPRDIQDAVLASDLKMYTPSTLVDPVRLRQRLEQVRGQGWHVSRGDVDQSGFSIAAPVYGRGDRVVAAVSLAGTINRLTPDVEAHYRELLIDYANRMSASLGGDAARSMSEQITA